MWYVCSVGDEDRDHPPSPGTIRQQKLERQVREYNIDTLGSVDSVLVNLSHPERPLVLKDHILMAKGLMGAVLRQILPIIDFCI